MSHTTTLDEIGRRGPDTDVAGLRAVIETQALINAAGLSTEEVMQVVVERTQQLTGAAGAVVELAEGDEMVYRAVSGSASGSLGLRLKRESSLSGLCVRIGEAFRCRDTETDPRVDLDACRSVGVRSMVVAPLAHRGAVIGALKVLSPAPDGFTARDVEILRLMAGFVAASLAHASQFEDHAVEMDELSRLNQALDGFSAHVAHDLKNPIAVVVMASSTLREELGSLPAETIELLDMIERHAARSGELIDGLLGLARASRTPNREAFDLGEVVEQAAEGVVGVRLENRCAGVRVVADRLATRQAVANLLSNGGRYATTGGAPATLTVDCKELGDGWRVTVADRGPGLPAEDRDRVFSAFEQGRQAGSVQGSGLGLAIVSAMAQAHGGRVGYEPRPGGGSVFWFSLHLSDLSIGQ